jgi:hypothetical protein
MNIQALKSKRELLRDKVVDLVKEFVNSDEGGVTGEDLRRLFGPDLAKVSGALAKIKMSSQRGNHPIR